MNALLKEIDQLKSTLNGYRPLSKSQLQKLEEVLFVEYTYESNRIEGNTLSLQETSLVIQKGITIQENRFVNTLKLSIILKQFILLKDIADKNKPFNERIIKELHALILRGIDKENAGTYRKVNVKISGSKYVPPDALKIQEMMDNYFAFYNENKNKIHPVNLSAYLHEKLVTIHPFIDGNGRTARLIMNLILLQYGYAMINITGDVNNRLVYYNALEKCQMEKNCDDFLFLITKEEIKLLKNYLTIIKTGNS